MPTRTLTRSLAAAAAIGLSLGAVTAQSAEVTLRFSHFWPANSKQHTEIFEAWAQTIEKESDGRIDVQIYPSQTLTPADRSYQATVNGVTDITATAQAYTAGRFPLSQIVELPPFGETAVEGSCVIQKLYQRGAIDQEYQDTHVLFLFTHGPGYLHTKERAVRKPEQLEGLRIRRPTAVVADMLERYGAAPVGMPAPEVYQSLQRGVIDGLTMPWEGMHVFRLTELTQYHTEVPLYRLIFVLTMNKDVYRSLPPELQQVIDDNSGLKWSLKAGRVFKKIDKIGRQAAVSSGDHVIIEGPEVTAAWEPALDKMIDNYLQKLENRGLPAQQVFDKAQSVLATCQKTGQNPGQKTGQKTGKESSQDSADSAG